MSLSPEDREWIGAIVGKAIGDSLNAARDFSRGMVASHAKDCPNLAKLKWMILGLGVGIGLVFPGLAKGLFALLTGHA